MGVLLSGERRPRRYFFFLGHQRFNARSKRAAGRSQLGQIWPRLVDARVDRRDGQLATAAARTIRRQPLSTVGHFDFSGNGEHRQKEMERVWILKSSRSARRGRGQKLITKGSWKRKGYRSSRVLA